jgi:Ca2+-binding RTX toxin-like protein
VAGPEYAMKKTVLTAMVILAAASGASVAHAGERSLNVLLTGGMEANAISIALSPDGHSYVVDSSAPLEVGGSVCLHPQGNPNEIVCEANTIAGFEVNAGAGDDSVVLAREVPVPVTLRGGPGNDRLVGGAGDDKLIGGAGDDVLVGRAGADWIYGGLGDDRLVGCSGDDLLRGGPGQNVYLGGSGNNDIAAGAVEG